MFRRWRFVLLVALTIAAATATADDYDYYDDDDGFGEMQYGDYGDDDREKRGEGVDEDSDPVTEEASNFDLGWESDGFEETEHPEEPTPAAVYLEPCSPPGSCVDADDCGEENKVLDASGCDEGQVCCVQKEVTDQSSDDLSEKGDDDEESQGDEEFSKRSYEAPYYEGGPYGDDYRGYAPYSVNYSGPADASGALDYGAQYLGHRDDLEKVLGSKDLYVKPYTSPGLYNEYLNADDLALLTERKSFIIFQAIRYLQYKIKDKESLGYVVKDLDGNYNKKYEDQKKGNVAYPAARSYTAPDLTYAYNDTYSKNGAPVGYYAKSSSGGCRPGKYRTYDGYCNNPNYPNWGRAFTVLNRLLAPRYADGVSAPRRGYNGYPLPNPRLISSYMVHDQSRPIYYNSLMVMQWGQFIVHDISFTPVYKARGTYGILCCAREIYTNPSLLHPECFPILVPKDDYFYSKQPGYTGCMEFVRSLAGTSYSGKREQLNQASSYIDGSLIYGSTEEHARSLRSYKHGQLTTVKKYGHHYIPITRHQCQHDPSECYRVKTGDSRANMHPWLTALHHVFVRYHNYVAYHLYRVNPDWDDEYLYQEARKVLGASLQYITYHEYLPALLGYDYLKRYGLVLKYYGYSYDYDAKVDASALNEFVTAAFRMGHSTIYGLIEWRSQEYGNGKFGPLRNHYFQAYETSEPGVMDKYILSTMTQWQETIDTYVTREVTNYLFKTKNTSYGFDLISLNIQRGRDHGLPGYNEYRKYCGLNKAYSFEDLYPSINKDVIDKLKYLYKTVDDIDLYIGGIAENPYRYSLLGPTFSCIVASQFQRLKKGDYYWHELGGQPWSFTLDQLTEIRKINLGWVFCHFADKIRYVQRWVFKTPGPKNPYFRCDDPKAFPVIDWGKWKAGGYNNASYGQANYSLPSYSPMASQGKYSYGGYGGYPPSGYGGYSNYSHDGYGGYPPSGYGGYSNYSYGGYGGYPPSGNGGYPPSGYGGYSNYSQDGYSGYPPLSKGGYSEYAQGRSFANYLKSTIYNSTRPQYAKSSYDGFNKFSYNASGNGDYGDYSGNGYGGYSGNGYGGYPGNGYGGYPMNTSYSGYSGNGYGGYSGNGYGGYPMNTSYSGYSGNGYGSYPVNTSYSTEYHSSNYSDDDGQAYERYPRGEGYGGRPPGYSSPYISSTFQGKPPYGPSSSGNGYGPNKNNSYTSSASNYTSHGSGSRYSSSGGSYGYGAQGRSFTAMDYTPASGAGGSYGGAPAYGTGSSYGAAPGYPAGSSYGGAPAYPAGSSYGGAPAYPAGSSYGGAPAYGAGSSYGGAPAYGAGSSYGGAPAYGAGSSYGGAPAYGAGSSYGGAPAYGMGDSYGSAPAYGGYGADYYGSKDYGGYDTSLYGSGYGKGGYGEAYDSSDYGNRYAGTEYDKGGDYGGKAHDYGASYAGADYDASHGYGGKAHDRGDYYGSKAYDHGDRYDASAYGAGTAYNDTAYDAAARYADRAYGKGYGTNDSAYSAAGLYDKDAYAKAAAQDYYTHGASDRYHDVGYGQADRYKTGARDYGAQYGGQAYDTGKAYGASDYDAASHYDAASKAKADAYDAGQAQKYGSLYGSAGATGDKYYTASADSGDKAHGQIEYTDTGYSTSSYGSDASYGSSSYGTNKTYGGGGSAHNVSLTGDYDKSSYDTGKAYGKDKYDATSAYGASYYDQSKYHGGARYDADAYAKAGAHDYGKAQYGADYDSAAKYGGTAYDTSRDYDAARASYGTETDAARYADTKAYGAAKYDAGLKEGAKYYDQGKAHGAAGYDYGSRTDADAYDRGRGHGEAQYGYGAKAAASAYDTARASDAARYDAASDYYGAGAAKAKQYSGDVYDARKDYGGQYHDKAKSYDADAYGRKKTYDKTGYGAYGQDYGAGAHGQQYGSAYGQQYGGGYRAPPGGYYSDAPYADDASAAVVESPTEPPKGRSYQKYTVAGTEYYVSKEIHPTDAPGAPVNGEKPYERSFPIGKGAEDAFLAGKDYAGASYDSAKALAAHQFVNKTKYEESMQSKSKKFESEVYSSQNDTKVHAAGDKGTLSEALAKASSAMENEMVDLEAQRRSTTTTAAPSPQWTGQAHRPPPNVRPNGQRLPYRRPA